jgi:SAM-dependent methyltransferase
MMKENSLKRFYKDKVESGGHINLKNAILSYLRKSNLRTENYLDIGCGDGSFTAQIANLVGAAGVFGVDISPFALKEARKKGIVVNEVNINEDNLPFDDDSIGLITSFELIEHLVNTDNLLREAYRVLKPKGYFILSTPNIASWINRLYILLGRLPRNYEVSLSVKLDCAVKGTYRPIGHIRLYTLRALKEHLIFHGFKVVKTLGCPQPISIHNKDPRITVGFAGYLHNFIDYMLGRSASLSNSFAIISRK